MATKPVPQWWVRLDSGLLEGPFENRKKARGWADENAPGSQLFVGPVIADVSLAELHDDEIGDGLPAEPTLLKVVTESSADPHIFVTRSLGVRLKDYFTKNGFQCRIEEHAVGPADKSEDILYVETTDVSAVEATLTRWRHEQVKR